MKQYLWRNVLYNKIAWVSLGFALALMIFEEWLRQTRFIPFLIFVFTQIENVNETFIRVGVQVMLTFLVTAWFVWVAIKSRPAFKLVYLIIFVTVTCLQYGFQLSLNNYIALQDIHTALGSFQNWDEAIMAYFNWWALIPVLCFGGLLFVFGVGGTYDVRQFVMLCVTIFALNVVTVYYSNLDAREQQLRIYTAGPSVSLPAFFRVVSHLGLEQLTLSHFARETVSFKADAAPTNNIVFIVDESIRYDHLSVNGYHRPTTPYLEQLATQQQFHNWGLTVAGATCSLHSAAMLLTGVNLLPDKNFSLRTWPTIFQYARAMNYTTHYFDGEAEDLRFPLTGSDRKYIDDIIFADDLGIDHDTDLRLADRAAAILSRSTGNFVVIFKRGAHFPYSETFPNEQAIWKPILGPQEILSDDLDRVVNAYDNAIYHNINSFFQRLLAHPDVLNSTVILYTSDHAQNLGEVQNGITHCGQTRLEAAVPLLLITHQPLTVDTTFKAAHHNVFATLLDLMNVPEDERRQRYQISLLKATAADSTTRRYFQGSIFGLGKYQLLEFD